MTTLQKLCMLGVEDASTQSIHHARRVFTVRDRIIEHDDFNMVVRAIARLHERYTAAKVPGALLVYGQSGAGKSTVLRYYVSSFPRRQTPRKTIIPVFRMVTPEAPTVRSFTEAFLVALGDVAAARGSAAIKTQRIIHFVKECEIELILVDEFHHFCDSNSGERRRVTDWLKNLLNECGVPIVLFGLPRAISALYSNDQLRRRFASPLQLKEFGFNTRKEQETFRGILQALQRLLPLKSKLDFSHPELAMRFHFATNGLIDYIIKIIDELVINSADTNNVEIDYSDLQKAFQSQIWADAPDTLNPFNTKIEPRRLDKANEPFSLWDDPANYTLSNRAKKASGL